MKPWPRRPLRPHAPGDVVTVVGSRWARWSGWMAIVVGRTRGSVRHYDVRLLLPMGIDASCHPLPADELRPAGAADLVEPDDLTLRVPR